MVSAAIDAQHWVPASVNALPHHARSAPELPPQPEMQIVVEDSDDSEQSSLLAGRTPPFSIRRLLQYMGPGWLMSVAFLDPGNLESDLQAGAVAGYRLLWLLLVAHIIGLVYQVLAARLAVVTHKPLGEHIREQLPRPLLRVVWLAAELALLGADIQLVIGTAIALQVVLGLPLWCGVLLTMLNAPILYLSELFGQQRDNSGGKRMEWCFAAVIGIMAGCFFWVMFYSDPDWDAVLAGLLFPSVPQEARMQAVGLIGATVMPHNILLHSALIEPTGMPQPEKTLTKRRGLSTSARTSIGSADQYAAPHAACKPPEYVAAPPMYGSIDAQDVVCEERRALRNRKAQTTEANMYLAVESGLTLFLSFLINTAILISFAGTFSTKPHMTHLPGLFDAGNVLKKALGPTGALLWGAGLFAAGQAATMTLTMTGQRIIRGFWALHIPAWCRLTMTRSVSLIPALLVAGWMPHRMDDLGEWLNVLQCLCLPFILIPLLKLTNAAEVMDEFRNSSLFRVVAWMLLGLILIMNAILVVDTMNNQDWHGQVGMANLVLCSCVVACCLGFYWRLAQCPFTHRTDPLTSAATNGLDTSPIRPAHCTTEQSKSPLARSSSLASQSSGSSGDSGLDGVLDSDLSKVDALGKAEDNS